MSNIQLSLFPDEHIKIHNNLCLGQWDIKPMAHRVVLLVALAYKHHPELFKGDKFGYVDVKISDIVPPRSGTRQYEEARDLLAELRSAGVVMCHNLTPGELELEDLAIFRGRIYYSEKKDTMRVCFNQDLREFFCELNEHYTKLMITEMLELPNDRYTRVIYQFFKSLEFKQQFEIDVDKFIACFKSPYADWGTFKKRVLNPARENIINITSLQFDYDEVKGAHGKVYRLHFWYDWSAKKIAERTQRLEKKERIRVRQEASIENFVAEDSATSVSRITTHDISIDGHIDNCKDWVYAHHGKWAGYVPGTNFRKLTFMDSRDAKKFIEICKKRKIKVIYN